MRLKHDVISRLKPLKNLRRQMGVGVGDIVEIVHHVGCLSALAADIDQLRSALHHGSRK